jgi:hypothetical protein
LGIEIDCNGHHYDGPLNRGMLFVAQQAAVSSIAPSALHFHEGTPNRQQPVAEQLRIPDVGSGARGCSTSESAHQVVRSQR